MGIPLRLGRIGYLNVLPIHHALHNGLARDLSIVSGPPAQLNDMMARGELDISGASSIEYARRPERYLLVPDLAIGSKGPVQSVLLLSREPLNTLKEPTILVSSQTHTSAALLRILLAESLRLPARFETGDATDQLVMGKKPQAVLAIGDEALRLRHHPAYPHRLDLGEAWRQWTGLPFIFGLWLVRREAAEKSPAQMAAACRSLLAAKNAGLANMPAICRLAADALLWAEQDLQDYFAGLSFDLGEEEQAGLKLFYEHLAAHGLIPAVPDLCFFPL